MKFNFYSQSGFRGDPRVSRSDSLHRFITYDVRLTSDDMDKPVVLEGIRGVNVRQRVLDFEKNNGVLANIVEVCRSPEYAEAGD